MAGCRKGRGRSDVAMVGRCVKLFTHSLAHLSNANYVCRCRALVTN